MTVSFAPILSRALKHAGGEAALAARLPKVKTTTQLKRVGDDRYLSLMQLRIFRAGIKHAVVDAKWPAFEAVFHGFDPARVAMMNDEAIEKLMADARLIRHLGKLRSVPANAAAMQALAREEGSCGAYLAAWPGTEIMALWEDVGRRFTQMGGNSAPYWLRMAGKDTFILTPSVLQALAATKVIAGDKVAGKAEKAKVQAAFNAWAKETERPLAELSMILAASVG
jgi:3-methyladenine DNA glycosylase Tag